MGLIEFGDNAYVITRSPTLRNILLSTSLIGDWNEFMPSRSGHGGGPRGRAGGRFVPRPSIPRRLGQLMVISRTAPTRVLENGKTVDDVLGSQRAKIPVLPDQIGGNIENKRSVADDLWIGAVKRTGGAFFSGATNR